MQLLPLSPISDTHPHLRPVYKRYVQASKTGWSLMEYYCEVSDSERELIQLLCSLRSPFLARPKVIKSANAVQAVGCLIPSINAALMDGVKSGFLLLSLS